MKRSSSQPTFLNLQVINSYSWVTTKVLLKCLVGLCVLAIVGFNSLGLFEDSDKVNVILITADDLGIGRFKVALEGVESSQFNASIYDRDSNEYTLQQNVLDAKKSISNLAELAKEGTYFNNAFSTSPWCSPSRLGLLTGTYPQQSKVWAPADVLREPATESSFFLNELFQDAGYVTGIVGKWHLSNSPLVGRSEGQFPTSKGFDHYWGFDHCGTEYYNSTMLESNYAHEPAVGFLTDQILSKSIEFIDSNKSENFFLYLPFNAPHGPLDLAPQRYYELFDSTGSYSSNDTLNHRVLGDYNRNVNYHAHVKALDVAVGKLIQYLKLTGLSENTVVIFTSDHGAPGFDGVPLPGNSPYNGYKGQLDQGGLRVPLFFWSEGVNIDSRINNQLVSHMDLISTSLDLCGIAIPDSLDLKGRSLKQCLSGSESSIHEVLIWAGYTSDFQGFRSSNGFYNRPRWMAQNDQYRLIYEEKGGLSLYHEDDFLENNDLSHLYPEIVYSLHEAYTVWYSRVANQPYDDIYLYEVLHPKNSTSLLAFIQ